MKKMFAFILSVSVSLVVLCQSNVSVPDSLSASEVDYSAAVLSWDDNDDSYGYIVVYKIIMQEDSIQVFTTNNHLSIQNLVSATQYLWKVCRINYDGDTSAWTAWNSFHTLGLETSCNDVDGLVVAPIDGQQTLIQWESDTLSAFWEIVCDNIGTNPDNTGARYFTSMLEHRFNSLEQGGKYQFAVRSHCSSSSVGNWKYMYYKNVNMDSVFTMPFDVYFSDSLENEKIGLMSSNHNPWIIKDGVMYASYDGEDTTVTSMDSAISYAYMDFNVGEDVVGLYVDFAYKSNIVFNSSGMRVYLVDAANNMSTSTLPNNVFLIGQGIYSNTSGLWQREHIYVPQTNANGVKRLLFVWINSTAMTGNSTLFVDSVSVSSSICPTPDSLHSTNITAYSAMLSWHITSAQQSYRLRYRSEQDSIWTEIENIENNYVLENLSQDTKYYYKVSADCYGDTSLWSEVDSFSTHILALPVDSLTATPNYNSAHLSWRGNISDAYYIVYYKENIYSLAWQSDTTSYPYYNLSSLQSGTQYVYRVRAVNGFGDTSVYSSQKIFSTLCSPVETFPYEYSGTIDYNSVSHFVNIPACFDTLSDTLYMPVFNMTALENAEMSFFVSNSAVINLYASTDEGQTYNLINAIPQSGVSTADFVPYTISLGYLSTIDDVRLRFVVTRPYSAYFRLRDIRIYNACHAPTYAQIDTISENMVGLSWERFSNSSSWKAYLYNEDDSLLNYIYTSSPNAYFYNLDTGADYHLVIKTECMSENSDDSLVYEFSTIGRTSCPIPQNLEAYHYVVKGDETINVTWQSTEDVQMWILAYKDRYALAWNEVTVLLTPTYNIRNLDNDRDYVIKVRSLCSVGDTSSWSETDTVLIRSGVAEVIGEEIAVFPIPTNDILTIKTDKTIKDAILVDMGGNIMNRWAELPKQISLRNYHSGKYILLGKVFGRQFTKQIIISR